MERNLVRYLSIFCAMVFCFVGSFAIQNINAATKLNKTSIVLTVGKSKQLKLVGKSKNIKWSSSKKTVAIVNQKGKVTGKKQGKTNIIAKYKKKKYICKVVVKNKAKQTIETPSATEVPISDTITVNSDGIYDKKEEVALYLYQYQKLPSNYITKEQAKELGWNGGGLDPYAPGKCIGGDYFGNYEEILPIKEGRSYKECDIDTLHANTRGVKRLVYSNDGLIYYTEDHYQTFQLLYGTE